MRRINAARVLREIRHAGAMSRADLARATGLSKPTITNVVEQLCASGQVQRVAASATELPVGRRPQLYELCADARRVVGIDIGGDKLVVVVASMEGEVLNTRRRDTARLSSRSPARMLALVRETTTALLADSRVDMGDLLAVGVGTPGVVSSEGVVTLAPQLRGWEGLDLGAAFREMFSCPVHVEREVTLSLLAEQWIGVAQDLDDALFVQLGVGVGAALLLGGQAYRGADGGAGEIGLMPSGPRPKSQSTGGAAFGPFESATGGAALAREGAAAARSRGGSRLLALAGGDPDAVTAAMVFASAADGDKTAMKILDRAIDVLAEGIAGLVCALNPSAVILSGGLSRAGEQLRAPLEQRVAAQVPFPPKFVISTVGDEGVALGAARRVIQALDSELSLPALNEAQ
jgi:predicted NBD/HSP70 family sugar kinase